MRLSMYTYDVIKERVFVVFECMLNCPLSGDEQRKVDRQTDREDLSLKSVDAGKCRNSV